MEDDYFVSFDGLREGDWPVSSEWRMHDAIYRRRPEINAVLHFHGRPMINDNVIIDAANEGTQVLAEQVASALWLYDHAYIEDHGNVIISKDMQQLITDVEIGKWNV